MFGSAISLDRRFDYDNRVNGPDRTTGFNRQALLGEFVDQGQNSQCHAVFQLILNDVPTPNMIGPLGLLTLYRRDFRPPGPPLLLAHSEPGPPPHSLDPLNIDAITFGAQQCRDESVAVTRMRQ
jgi:hypothetical protein